MSFMTQPKVDLVSNIRTRIDSYPVSNLLMKKDNIARICQDLNGRTQIGLSWNRPILCVDGYLGAK
mgnify:CR=1 FL=1